MKQFHLIVILQHTYLEFAVQFSMILKDIIKYQNLINLLPLLTFRKETDLV
jgi:hypothetical protein